MLQVKETKVNLTYTIVHMSNAYSNPHANVASMYVHGIWLDQSGGSSAPAIAAKEQVWYM